MCRYLYLCCILKHSIRNSSGVSAATLLTVLNMAISFHSKLLLCVSMSLYWKIITQTFHILSFNLYHIVRLITFRGVDFFKFFNFSLPFSFLDSSVCSGNFCWKIWPNDRRFLQKGKIWKLSNLYAWSFPVTESLCLVI